MEVRQYTFVENPEYKFLGIKIESGRYSGLIFHFTHGSVNPPNEKGEVRLNFDYNIISKPSELTEKDLADKELIDTLGDIFVTVLEKTFTENEFVLTDNIEQRKAVLNTALDEYENNKE